MAIVLKSDNEKWMDTFIFFLESEHCPPTLYPIILFIHHNLNRPYILYNTEQLTRKNQLEYFCTTAMHPNCMEVWDYSKANIEILSKCNIKAHYHPPIMPNSYLSVLRSFRQQEIKYDIGFCGDITQRRMYIIDQLNKYGYHILIISNMYGEDRDKQLATCKVLLNIHAHEDYQIFESARCEPWLAIGVSVISEQSLDNDSRCINVSYDEIVNKTIEVLQTIL
jgi:hypothetical protein